MPDELDIDIQEEPSQLVAAARRVVPMAGLKDVFDDVLPRVPGTVAAAGGTVAGPPFGWYHGVPTETVDVSVGFPVAGLEAGPLGGDVEVVERPGGRALVGMHVGPYEELERSYGEMMSRAESEGLSLAADMWEEYLSDPSAEPDPSTWRTRLVLLLA